MPSSCGASRMVSTALRPTTSSTSWVRRPCWPQVSFVDMIIQLTNDVQAPYPTYNSDDEEHLKEYKVSAWSVAPNTEMKYTFEVGYGEAGSTRPDIVRWLDGHLQAIEVKNNTNQFAALVAAKQACGRVSTKRSRWLTEKEPRASARHVRGGEARPVSARSGGLRRAFPCAPWTTPVARRYWLCNRCGPRRASTRLA